MIFGQADGEVVGDEDQIRGPLRSERSGSASENWNRATIVPVRSFPNNRKRWASSRCSQEFCVFFETGTWTID